MKFGLKSLLRYFASKVWNMMPAEIKDSTSVEVFFKKIRSWSLVTVTANFVKIIWIALDMLTWFIMRLFVTYEK